MSNAAGPCLAISLAGEELAGIVVIEVDCSSHIVSQADSGLTKIMCVKRFDVTEASATAHCCCSSSKHLCTLAAQSTRLQPFSLAVLLELDVQFEEIY